MSSWSNISRMFWTSALHLSWSCSRILLQTTMTKSKFQLFTFVLSIFFRLYGDLKTKRTTVVSHFFWSVFACFSCWRLHWVRLIEKFAHSDSKAFFFRTNRVAPTQAHFQKYKKFAFYSVVYVCSRMQINSYSHAFCIL